MGLSLAGGLDLHTISRFRFWLRFRLQLFVLFKFRRDSDIAGADGQSVALEFCTGSAGQGPLIEMPAVSGFIGQVDVLVLPPGGR